MSYKHVIRIFEDRKGRLQDIMEARELEEPHKMRLVGAIDEIEFLLTTLRHEMRVSEGGLTNSEIPPITLQELEEEKKQLEVDEKAAEEVQPMQEFRKVQDEG